MRKKTVIIILIICSLTFTYSIYDLLNNKYFNTYYNFLFPDIRLEEEIIEIYNDNKDVIDDFCNNLLKITENEIYIDHHNTYKIVYNSQLIDMPFDEKTKNLIKFLKKECGIEYINKINFDIFLATDNARDYEQGLLYSINVTDINTHGQKKVFYLKNICENIYFYKAH